MAAVEERDIARPGEEEEEEVTDLSNSDVVTKYRLAADIANTTLQGVISQCKAGANIVDICKFGDALIEGQCAKNFKSKKVEKGIAFPTTISVNECVCHYSPLPHESTTLKENDTVKIDLGAHIDGFIAVVGHTVKIGQSAEDAPEVSGPEADVVVAAHKAAEVCVRMIKPGNKNYDVTKAIERVAEAYGVTPIQATLTHQLKQFIIDGNKVMIQKDDPDQKVEEMEFEQNEVYAIDIAFSTGSGKPKLKEDRTTVFKRALDNNYMLKMKASRYVLNEINRRFPTLPFTVRAFDDEKQARMGVVEMERSEMLHAYPVIYEKEGDHVAHFKFTVLLLPNGTLKVTGMDMPQNVKSDKKLPEDIEEILKQVPHKSGRRRRKKKSNK